MKRTLDMSASNLQRPYREFTGLRSGRRSKAMAIKGLRQIVQSVRAFGRGIAHPPLPAAPQKLPSIGVALGGGFARGIVHIGILKVLEE